MLRMAMTLLVALLVISSDVSASDNQPQPPDPEEACAFYGWERGRSYTAKGDAGIYHWTYAAYELCIEINTRVYAGIEINDNMKAALQVLQDYQSEISNVTEENTGVMGYYGPTTKQKLETAERVGLLAVLEAFEDGW